MASPDREKWLDVFDTPYSNGANTAANGLFLSLICLSLVACVAITWKTRRCIPYSFVLCVAYLFEIITYALRFQGWDFTTFSVQYGLATITPVFVTMAIHLATAEATAQLGAEHAPLSPSAHLRTFVWTDIACLCIQALGLSLTFSGARAAGPWGLMLPARAHTGQTLLFVGLLFQTLALAAALLVLAITYVRASSRGGGAADRTQGYATFPSHRGRGDNPAVYAPARSPRCKLFLAALPLAGACVLVRCAYRTAAAWGGLGSPIARDVLLWLVVEGALLTEAMVSLVAFHPALCLDYDLGGGGGGGSGRTHTQDLEAGRRHEEEMMMAAGKHKRYSSGTLMSMAYDGGAERKMHEPPQEDFGGEGSHLIFSSNVMAPSEAGSSDAAGGSRRGSAGAMLEDNPYYRYEDPFAGSPDPYDQSPYYEARYSAEDVTAESRALSPVEAEAEEEEEEEEAEDRLETESFVQPPRKSSKRQSRVLSLTEAQLAAEAEDQLGDAESFVSPPRKSSKRVPPPPPPMRGLSVRSDDDQLEVASFVLPSRKPSKMSTMRGSEELDAVSLYSQ